jgi:hypothetical protein
VKVAFSRHILEKYSKIKFREYPSMVGELLQAADKQTDIKVLTVDFRNLANAPKQNDIHDIKTLLL